MKVNANPLRDIQDPAPAEYGDCGHEVYRGESLLEWEGRMLCPDCWRRAAQVAESYAKDAREKRATQGQTLGGTYETD